MTQSEVENLFALPTDDDEFMEETKVVTNRAYLAMSNRFRVAAWVTVIVLAAFLVGMFYAFKDEITVENFRFLMRNVNFRLASSVPTDENGGGLLYDRDADRQFALYRDYVATVGNNRLTICDKNGNQSYNEALEYGSPAIRTSSGEIMFFDRGGTEYSLYSYFNKVTEGSLDYPIIDGDICDAGIYAIATREDHYYGSVLVYNAESKLIQRIRKDKYVIDIDLTSDGKSILVTSFYTDTQGLPITEVSSHPTASTKVSYTLTLTNTLPYSASYLADGSVALVCADGVKFIDTKGKIYNTSTFSGQNVLKYVIGDDCVSYVSASDTDATKLTLTVCRSDKKTHSASISGQPELLDVSGGCTYLYNSEKLCILDNDSGALSEYTTDAPQAILVDGDRVYLCLNTKMVELVREENARS